MKVNIFRILCVGFIICALHLGVTKRVWADYVLPYPSVMPGNKLYTLSRMLDRVKKYWYFGTIAQIKYHISLSDKYLVEAKTLFEYKQYALGMDALKRSNEAFAVLPVYIQKGHMEGKNMDAFVQMIREAGAVHINVCTSLANTLPATFSWTPENGPASELFMLDALEDSISTVTIALDNMDT